MRFLVWLLRAFLFFALFAFALNNRHNATVHWFFGQSWNAPLVIVVLAAFAGGCAVGVLAMVPAWWHHRRQATRAAAPDPAVAAAAGAGVPAAAEAPLDHPPREAL
ncbi:LapA family protein [Azohydromonas aeria]|uniref:LapA family protein n=1 Tax=Azohydromonas aeria TaxID=2590212 RepID=UPI0012FB78D8|nr:LapA family protein [Azohydromonas aeria]